MPTHLVCPDGYKCSFFSLLIRLTEVFLLSLASVCNAKTSLHEFFISHNATTSTTPELSCFAFVVSVGPLCETMECSMTTQKLREDYPELEGEDVLACLAFAAKLLSVKRILAVKTAQCMLLRPAMWLKILTAP